MTDPAASEPAGLPVQPSLLHPLDELALIPPGLVPDPEVMVQFITGADAGGTAWHAIERRRAEHVSTQAAGGVTVAVCGALARVTSHGVYDRAARPVAYGPCQVCAWTVAIATGSMERELRLTTPDDRSAAAMARVGVDPLLAVKVCRAVLAKESSPAAENGLDHDATAQVLACASAHRPILAIPEECAEDDRSCSHYPGEADTDEGWRCEYPACDALCLACTLRAGSWAGGWAGDVMDECRVIAPCDALRALAAHYGLVDAARPGTC